MDRANALFFRDYPQALNIDEMMATVGPSYVKAPEFTRQPLPPAWPNWLPQGSQFVAQKALETLSTLGSDQVPSWQMPYPMPATQGERDMLGMLPVAGDVEDMRYLVEGMQQGDPVKAGIGGAATALPFIPASLLHTVYHGSPHIFDAFRMDKIGTGEGAQAYGHGLYFAESPGVAHSYKTAGATYDPDAVMSIKGRVKVTDNRGKPLGINPEAASYLANAEGDFRQAIKAAETDWDNAGSYIRQNEISDSINQLESVAKRRKYKPAQVNEIGGVYTVEIPDEAVARMLDWDKPLSEQPESVREAIESRLNPNQNMFFDGQRWIPFDDMRKTGRSLYEAVARFHGQEVASDILRQAGVPGIRYLDQMSRSGGEGTRNLVLFDESLAKILRRE